MGEVELDGSKCFGWELHQHMNQFWFHEKDVYSGFIPPSVIRLVSPKTGNYKKFYNTHTKWYSNGLFSNDFNGNKIIGHTLTFREDDSEDRLYILLANK